MTDRNLLRTQILEIRNGLTTDERRTASRLILKHLMSLAEFRQARTFFTYVNFRSEVETLPLIRILLQEGKRVTVPFTDRQAVRLIPYLITDPERDLASGYCGIPEPDPLTSEAVDPETIDIIILPGSVFDAKGGRLGYGGGYYDRFLARDAPQALRIGIAFGIQIVESVPTMPHDQPLDYLITEKGVLKIQQ